MKKKLIYLFVILFIFTFSLQLFSNKVFGVDAFFHYKFVQIMFEENISSNFPWLYYTDFNTNFSDQRYLFHLILHPFTYFAFPYSLKIFISLFSALFFTLFYFILNKMDIKKPELWLFILIFSSNLFIFRLQLGRPLLFTISLSLIGIYLLMKEKKWFLLFWPIIFILSSYGSILIILIILFSYLLIKLLILKKFDWLIFIIVLIGIILGLIIHPQLFNFLNIIFTNYSSGLLSLTENIKLTPAELNNYNLISFIITSLPLVLLLFFSFLICLINLLLKTDIDLEKKKNYYFLFLLSIIFLILTLIFYRFIEYLAPIIILFTAYSYNLFEAKSEFISLSEVIFIKLNKLPFKILIALTIISLIYSPIKQISTSYNQAQSIDTFKETALWLKNNTPKNSIIFNVAWDSFTRLFFFNHHNYYIIGLDPVFLFKYNKELYYLWENISLNICAENIKINECPENKKTAKAIAESIVNNFNTEYIWLPKNNKYYLDLSDFLKNNSNYFELMIETEDSIVYKINYKPSLSN